MKGVYDSVVATVSEMIATAIAEQDDALDVLDVDAGVRGLLRLIGLRATQRVTDVRVGRALAEAASRGFIVNRSSKVSVSCLYGELSVSSPYMTCRESGENARPVRDLGLTHRAKTPALERALTDFGIEDSFGLAAARFEEHYGWEIHRTSLLRVVHDAASDAAAYVRSRLAKEPEGVEAASCLLVEMDGCELPTGLTGSPHETQRTPVRDLPRRTRPQAYRDVRLAFVRDLYDDTSKTFVGGMYPFAEVVDQMHAAARHHGLSTGTIVRGVIATFG